MIWEMRNTKQDTRNSGNTCHIVVHTVNYRIFTQEKKFRLFWVYNNVAISQLNDFFLASKSLVISKAGYFNY